MINWLKVKNYVCCEVVLPTYGDSADLSWNILAPILFFFPFLMVEHYSYCLHELKCFLNWESALTLHILNSMRKYVNYLPWYYINKWLNSYEDIEPWIWLKTWCTTVVLDSKLFPVCVSVCKEDPNLWPICRKWTDGWASGSTWPGTPRGAPAGGFWSKQYNKPVWKRSHPHKLPSI